MSDVMQVFDRKLVRRHRDRAAARFRLFDFLIAEVADRLADRLLDVTRNFPVALDLGCHDGVFGRVRGDRGGVDRLVQADLSKAMVARARKGGGSRLGLVADEEALPFADASFDLVTSVLSLHWVNDLPGALVQINRVLKPDGLFLAAMLGGGTLAELRQALMTAELAEKGGAGPRVSPFADVRDAGGLLQRAGFALPVVDADLITVTYDDPFKLMADLKGMGEANAVLTRPRSLTSRGLLLRAAATYVERYGQADGRVPASFQVLYLTAWRPAASQPKALRPGSASQRLAQALGVLEMPAGDKTCLS